MSSCSHPLGRLASASRWWWFRVRVLQRQLYLFQQQQQQPLQAIVRVASAPRIAALSSCAPFASASNAPTQLLPLPRQQRHDDSASSLPPPLLTPPPPPTQQLQQLHRKQRSRCFFSTSLIQERLDDTSIPSSSPPPQNLTLSDSSSVLDYDGFRADLERAASWNHGSSSSSSSLSSSWDAEFCRSVVDRYDAYLMECLHNNNKMKTKHKHNNNNKKADPMLSSETVTLALKVLLKAKLDSDENNMIISNSNSNSNHPSLVTVTLSSRLRSWERALGQLQQTPLTDHLSLRLLTASAKAGHVGRVLALLKLRKDRGYTPRSREFEFAVESIRAAQNPRRRNLFVGDTNSAGSSTSTAAFVTTTRAIHSAHLNVMPLDNPTRWLDAILINMRQRNFSLTTELAGQMLQCYASGYTGKALHHFYRVVRRPIVDTDNDDTDTEEKKIDYDYEHTTTTTTASTTTPTTMTSMMPRGSFYMRDDRTFREYPTQVAVEYNRSTPPFYKVPSLVGRQALGYYKNNNKTTGSTIAATETTSMSGNSESGSPSGTNDSSGWKEKASITTTTKLDLELDPQFSPALAAAFAFADSLQLGAAGHDKIKLDTKCYNALIAACVQRGALWRAMQVLESMNSNNNGNSGDNGETSSGESSSSKPDVCSYNLLLTGLARVGDVQTMQEYTSRMLLAQSSSSPSSPEQQVGLVPDAFTVRAIVDGLLNMGDLPGAITVVQDFFNQHSVLPPYTTHLKILELCLARSMIHEAKRHLYFVQQLWKWEPNPKYHSPEFIKLMRATQRNTQLQRPALEELFAYFGERLTDSDFF